MFALILITPYVSADKYGVVLTAPPRNINSATTPLRGAVENTMLPLITAYESDYCLTPLKNSNTDASLPYS